MYVNIQVNININVDVENNNNVLVQPSIGIHPQSIDKGEGKFFVIVFLTTKGRA